jgi:hypothetical protein
VSSATRPGQAQPRAYDLADPTDAERVSVVANVEPSIAAVDHPDVSRV